MTRTEKKAFIAKVAGQIRIAKVVCTRSVKGHNGDSFVGFSAAHSSIQEDVGMGTDLSTTMTDSETRQVGDRGFTLTEAKVAGYLLAMSTDIAAHEHAYASGGIREAHFREAVAAIRHNYTRLVSLALGD